MVVLKSFDTILKISPCRKIGFLDTTLKTPLLIINVFYLPNVARLRKHEFDTPKTAGHFVLVILARRYVHPGCLFLEGVVFGLTSMGLKKTSY